MIALVVVVVDVGCARGKGFDWTRSLIAACVVCSSKDHDDDDDLHSKWQQHKRLFVSRSLLLNFLLFFARTKSRSSAIQFACWRRRRAQTFHANNTKHQTRSTFYASAENQAPTTTTTTQTSSAFTLHAPSTAQSTLTHCERMKKTHSSHMIFFALEKKSRKKKKQRLFSTLDARDMRLWPIKPVNTHTHTHNACVRRMQVKKAAAAARENNKKKEAKSQLKSACGLSNKQWNEQEIFVCAHKAH